MRKLSRLAALGLSGILALGLAACGGGTGTSDTPSGTESPAAGTESPAAAGETFVVGICQQMQHVALDEATRGFIETLEEKLGTSVEIQEQNASGEAANCTTIINNFVSQGVDLILCNGTTALQAAVAATGDIPILGTSITAWPGASTVSPAPPASTGPEPPTWPPWTSRRPCSRSGSPTPRTWAWSTAPPSPTPTIRYRP